MRSKMRGTSSAADARTSALGSNLWVIPFANSSIRGRYQPVGVPNGNWGESNRDLEECQGEAVRAREETN